MQATDDTDPDTDTPETWGCDVADYDEDDEGDENGHDDEPSSQSISVHRDQFVVLVDRVLELETLMAMVDLYGSTQWAHGTVYGKRQTFDEWRRGRLQP